jgi:hypothetical protein
MVRSGIVKHIDRANNTGIIEDKRGREFFFSIAECCENELPQLYTVVTFVKDPDYKSTDVAALIKRCDLFNAA